MSKFSKLLNNPFALHKYLVICEPITSVTSGTDISVTGGNTFTSLVTKFDFRAGDTIIVTGDPKAENNATYTVLSGLENSVTVDGILTNHSAGASIGLGKVERVYFSSGKFVTNTSVTPPTGAPILDPHIAFEARLDRALYFERSIYSGGAIGGNSIPGFGTIEAINLDGYLDGFNDYIWTKRPIWVLLGGDKFSYSDYGLIFTGLTDDVEVQDERLVIQMRDLKALFDVNIQPKTFAGSGSYEGGLEIKDKPKPKCYGRCLNISPIEVGKINGYRTFVFNDGAVAPYDADIHQVFDRGVALTYVASNPASGQWTLDTAHAAIIIGGDPDGPITANVLGDATGSFVDDVAGIVQRIVTSCPSDEPVLSASDIDSANITAFRALTLGSQVLEDVPIGIYVEEQATITDVLDRIMNSVGGFFGFTREGKFDIGRFVAPKVTPDFVIEKAEILDLTKETTNPRLSSLEITYAPLWTTLSESDLAASVRTNIVTNGNFDDSAGWTIPSGWSIAGGKAVASSTNNALSRTVAPVRGLEYRMTVELTVTAGSVQPKIGSTNLGPAITATGTHTYVFIAGADTSVSLNGLGFSGNVESFEIQPTVYWFFTEDNRKIKAEDTSIFSTETDSFDTLLIYEEDAQAEVDRQFALYSVQRNIFTVRAKIQPFALDVGDTVKITYHRWGLNSGKNLVVLEVKEDAWFNEVTLTLWG